MFGFLLSPHRAAARAAAVTATLALVLGVDAPAAGAASTATSVPAVASTAVSGATASVAGEAATSALVGVSALRVNGAVSVMATLPNGSARLVANQPGRPFAPAIDLGRPVIGTPAVAYTTATRRFDYFVVGSDHRLRMRSKVSGRWTGWRVVAQTHFGSGPTVTVGRDGLMHVFAVGTDRHVREVLLTAAGGLRGVRNLGGSATGSPAVVHSPGANSYKVFWTGTDAKLHVATGNGSRWAGGVAFTGAGYLAGVGATKLRDGRYAVVARRSDGHLYMRYSAGAGWGRYVDLGVGMHGKPAVTWGPTNDRVDVWAVGTDGKLRRRTHENGRWSGWSSFTGTGFGTATPSVAPAKQLLNRWGGALGGTPAAHADLAAAAAGRSVVGPCGNATKIDPKLIALLLKVTSRYRVTLNNLVTGRSCDSGQHPEGGGHRLLDGHRPADRGHHQLRLLSARRQPVAEPAVHRVPGRQRRGRGGPRAAVLPRSVLQPHSGIDHLVLRRLQSPARAALHELRVTGSVRRVPPFATCTTSPSAYRSLYPTCEVAHTCIHVPAWPFDETEHREPTQIQGPDRCDDRGPDPDRRYGHRPRRVRRTRGPRRLHRHPPRTGRRADQRRGEVRQRPAGRKRSGTTGPDRHHWSP